MRFTQKLLRFAPLPREYSRLKVLQSVAIRLKGKRRETPLSFWERLKFYLKITLLFISFPFRLRKLKDGTEALMYAMGSPEAVGKQRRYFLQKYALADMPEAAIREIHATGGLQPIWYLKMSWGKYWQLFRAQFACWRAARRSVWGKSVLHTHWKLRMMHMLAQQIAFHETGKRQFLFFSMEPDTYLSAMLAAVYAKGYQPSVVSANSALFSNNRYLYNPAADFKLCSRFQEEEVKSYQTRGWMNLASAELWGPEEALVFDHLPKKEATIDIGLYSSGSWARTHDLWRSGDFELLGKGGYLDNPMYLIFSKILDAIVLLRKENNYSAKVYLHPYERQLHREHGIRPPFLDVLDAHGIGYELEGGSSLDNFYESKVGVAVSSTITFDRIHHELHSLYYSGGDKKQFGIAPEYLGSFQEYCFGSYEELKEKLRKYLASGD